MGDKTQPIDPTAVRSANVLAIAATYVDPITKALYVHRDLEQVLPDWAVEQHISPIARTEKLGDVESWARYVVEFSDDNKPPLLTWSERGLSATLDYHQTEAEPGRCQWIARHDFERSHQWNLWTTLANGRPRTQRDMLEALEDLAPDIVEPDATTLLGVLRMLRATASAQADTELKPDGSTHVVYTKNNSVKAGELDLPAEFAVQVQVLKGHTAPTEDGKQAPVLYRLPVRVRVSVDDSAKLAIRLSMPTAERVLEAVFADRVEAAAKLLGDGYQLYRAAGS